MGGSWPLPSGFHVTARSGVGAAVPRTLPPPCHVPASPRTRRASERTGRADAERLRRRGDGPRVALAARGLGTTSPNPVVGCVLLDAARRGRRRGLPRLRRRAARRDRRAGPGRRPGPRRHRRGHPRTLRPHRPYRPLQPGADRRRGGAGWSSPSTTRTRSPPAAPRPCAPPGVEVDTGVRAAEAEAGNIAWLTAVRRGRPYVIWKYAATLDGRSAAADGTSMWITARGSADGRARAARHRRRGHRRRRHGPRRRPAADRPQPARRQPGDPPAAAGGRRHPRPYARRRAGPRRRRPHLDRHRRRGRRRPGRPAST